MECSKIILLGDFFFLQLYSTKKTEFVDTTSKTKVQIEDQNNNNIDEKPIEKTIFIDRIVKLALEDKIFTDENVVDELKTVLLAVRPHSIQYSLMHRHFMGFCFVSLALTTI